MSKINQLLFGTAELLVYMVFLLVYGLAVDPVWTAIDNSMYETWTKNNPELQASWGVVNTVSDAGDLISDTRSLVHKITNVFVFPFLPIGVVGRRIYKAMTEYE